MVQSLNFVPLHILEGSSILTTQKEKIQIYPSSIGKHIPYSIRYPINSLRKLIDFNTSYFWKEGNVVHTKEKRWSIAMTSKILSKGVEKSSLLNFVLIWSDSKLIGFMKQEIRDTTSYIPVALLTKPSGAGKVGQMCIVLRAWTSHHEWSQEAEISRR